MEPIDPAVDAWCDKVATAVRDKYNELHAMNETTSDVEEMKQRIEPQEETSGDTKLVLNMTFPPDITDEEIREFCSELVLSCDELHRAHGGHGLELSDLRRIK